METQGHCCVHCQLTPVHIFTHEVFKIQFNIIPHPSGLVPSFSSNYDFSHDAYILRYKSVSMIIYVPLYEDVWRGWGIAPRIPSLGTK